MILSKQLGVFLNFVHNRFKQNVNESFAEKGYGITAEQFLLLDTLWTEGTLTQQQIADIMLKDKNSVVKLIDGLQDRRYVSRISNPHDRRQNYIHVTPKAEDIREGATSIALETVNKIIDGIDERDLDTFIRVLDRMAQNMDKKVDLMGLAQRFPSNISDNG